MMRLETLLNLLWIFAASLVCCLILTPLARGLAFRCGLLDEPDGRRKTQTRAIPRTGGLAVLLSALLVLTAAGLLTPFGDLLRGQCSEWLGLGLGCMWIAVV